MCLRVMRACLRVCTCVGMVLPHVTARECACVWQVVACVLACAGECLRMLASGGMCDGMFDGVLACVTARDGMCDGMLACVLLSVLACGKWWHACWRAGMCRVMSSVGMRWLALV